MAARDRSGLRVVPADGIGKALNREKLSTVGSEGNYRNTQSLDLTFDRSSEPDDPRARQLRARDAAVRGGAKERIDFLLNEVFIHTPDFTHVISTVEQLISRARVFPNPGGMRITAPSGMGKNTIFRYFVRKYAPVPNGDTYTYPIIHVDFRERLAATKILQLLLRQLNSAFKSYQSIPDLEDNLFADLKACGTTGIFFNEAQHLLYTTQKNKRVGARLAGASGDWLKGFLDTCDIPVFFLGVPGWDEVFEQDEQLGTRVPHRYELSKFQFDGVFLGVLKALDEAIPMPEPAGLGDKELAWHLFSVSRGTWRLLIYLLRDAIYVASQAGVPRIELPDLSSAYQLQFGPQNNPFGPPRTP